MKNASQFRAEARTALTGKYWWAVLAGLIASLLGGVGSNGPTFNYNFDENSIEKIRDLFSDNPEIARAIFIVGGAILSVMATIGLALFIAGSAVELGYNRFNIKLYESGDKPAISDLFSRFDIFGKALGLRLLIWIKVLLWTLLLIVPGIIASFRYALAPYLLADNPNLTAKEAIEQSKALMNGHKWRLFCLGLSFIGWGLLACLTCGIGFVFLAPYTKAANTAFYLERKASSQSETGEAGYAASTVSEPAALEGGPTQL